MNAKKSFLFELLVEISLLSLSDGQEGEGRALDEWIDEGTF
jgi:hypothetical protein